MLLYRLLESTKKYKYVSSAVAMHPVDRRDWLLHVLDIYDKFVIVVYNTITLINRKT